MEQTLACGTDLKLIKEIERASESAVSFSNNADFASVVQHREAVERHRYVLRLISNYYNLARSSSVDSYPEGMMKRLFIRHQEYFCGHQKCIKALCEARGDSGEG